MAELSVRGVSVSFGGVRALNDVSLTVLPGQVNGLIGPNGAGKTTLFNVITGLERPGSGTVMLDGVDITRRKPFARGRLGLARTFQRLELFGSLSALDNVRVAIETGHRRRGSSAVAERALELLRRVGVEHVADEPADLLPTGLARLVELARALATEPTVLLLDEPGSGLDHDESAELGRVLTEIASDGVAVLLVEHDMSLVMSVCQQVSVLNFGEVIAQGTAAAVQDDPAVRTAYLGDVDALTLGDRVATAEDRPATVPVPAAPVSSQPVAVEMRGVSAAYGRIEVVHEVSLQVPRGSVLAIVGPNGAGKSTLLKVASGQMPPTAGQLLLDGETVRVRSPRRLARAGLCGIPEGRAIFPNLSVAENLLMYTYRGRQVRLSELEAASYERFPILEKRRKLPAGRLSGGEQRMLAVARALYTQPSILLLDELSHGLAPLIVAELYEAIREIVQREKMTAIVVEQFASIAFSIADLAAVMTHGQLSEISTPQSVQTRLEAAYLGQAAAADR